MSSLLGLAWIAVLVVVVAGGVALVHVALRPRTPPAVRASGALFELEPRGGRHRFPVRIVEVAALAAVWSTGIAVLALWTIAAPTLSTTGRAAAGVVAGALVVTTWWAWRRGALRARSTESDVDDEADARG